MTIRFVTIVFIALLSASGCNLIYKQNVQQGNALEQDDLDELYIGMSRRQVLFVLGTPSIRDPFHQDRWDYVQTFSRRGSKPIQRTVTLRFEEDSLSEILGADGEIRETASFTVDEDDESGDDDAEGDIQETASFTVGEDDEDGDGDDDAEEGSSEEG